MKKAEKGFFVDNLAEELNGAKSVILVNYTGLSVKAQQELKKRLKEADASMLVVKNTLLKLAGKKASIDKDLLNEEVLVGQTALVVSGSDPIAPIQVLGKFAKEFEVPRMKIGIINGSIQDQVALTKLATLPGRDILLGQVLGTLMAQAGGLVGILNGNMQKLVYILDQKSKS